MKKITAFIFCLLPGLLINTVAYAQSQDPLANLKRFSSFTTIESKRLFNDEVLSERGAVTAGNIGISAQFCFFVPASPEVTAQRLQNGTPLNTKLPNIYSHHNLPSKIELNHFQKLAIDPGYKPMKWLLDKTLATTPTKSELNLSRPEGLALSTCVGRDSSPHSVSACWADILYKRARTFQQKRFSYSLPYELSETEPHSPVEQLRLMIMEHPDVLGQLGPVLRGSGLINGSNESARLTPSYYWSIYDANHRATLNLGAFFKVALKDRLQVLDVEYYVSGSYYSSATIFEIYPISDGSRSGSLVWRGDFFTAPLLQYTKGIERIAYGLIMIQEIKNEIRAFQKNLKSE